MKFNVPSPKLNVVFEAITFADLRAAYSEDRVSGLNSLARMIGLQRLKNRPDLDLPITYQIRTYWDDKSGRYIVIVTWITWKIDGEELCY